MHLLAASSPYSRCAGSSPLPHAAPTTAFGKRYSVSGTVTYNGNPLEKGKISFVPEDPKGIGASGTIEKGYYVAVHGRRKRRRQGR